MASWYYKKERKNSISLPLYFIELENSEVKKCWNEKLVSTIFLSHWRLVSEAFIFKTLLRSYFSGWTTPSRSSWRRAKFWASTSRWCPATWAASRSTRNSSSSPRSVSIFLVPGLVTDSVHFLPKRNLSEKNLPGWDSNWGTSDPQPSTYLLSYKAIDTIDVKIDFYISPQTLDQYWSTLVSPPLLWYQLGLRGLFHRRRPPASPSSQFR